MEEVGRSLNSVWVITRQEMALFFNSPIVYIIAGVWMLIAGLFFAGILGIFNQGVAEPTMSNTLNTLVFLLFVIAPALSMSLISDELRAGTHELLLTAPVRDWEVIAGKWLGVFLTFTLMFVVITIIFPLILVWRSTSLDIGSIAAGYLGLWLAGAATLSIGIFASALTQYQLVAFFIAMGSILFLWISDFVSSNIVTDPAAQDVFNELSLLAHARNFVQRSLIDPVDVAYFIGFSLIFLFLATQVLGSRRWRG
jgi:ABC-2 type transport system permease protein